MSYERALPVGHKYSLCESLRPPQKIYQRGFLRSLEGWTSRVVGLIGYLQGSRDPTVRLWVAITLALSAPPPAVRPADLFLVCRRSADRIFLSRRIRGQVDLPRSYPQTGGITKSIIPERHQCEPVHSPLYPVMSFPGRESNSRLLTDRRYHR